MTSLGRRAFLHGIGGMAVAAMSPLRAAADATPVVETTNGRVQGVLEGGVHVFRGIPYGASTSGSARFMSPTAPKIWAGVRDCSVFGPSCPQLQDARDKANVQLQLIGNAWDESAILAAGDLHSCWANPRGTSEDCLVVNVWTPNPRRGKRPVMVWFHYGGFLRSSGSLPFNDGVNLCSRQDVVLVTLNHRINAFGYLHLKYSGLAQFESSVNIGQQDLIFALKWVRDNIVRFGGDPSRIMIFGQSGGGSKVGAMLATPSARGLFHRAAIHSTCAPGMTIESAERTLDHVLGYFEFSKRNADKLQNVSATDLVRACQAAINTPGYHARPIIDGQLIPRNLFMTDCSAVSADVPLLIGHCRTETVGDAQPGDFHLHWASLRNRLHQVLPELRKVEQTIAVYRRLKPSATPSDIFFDLLGISSNAIPMDARATKKYALGAAYVYRYCMEWRTPVDGDKWRSPHTLDLPMVFDTVDKSPCIVGTGAADAQKVADAMSAAWARFARTGNPNSTTLPQWRPFNPTSRPTMLFNVNSACVNDPYKQERQILGIA